MPRIILTRHPKTGQLMSPRFPLPLVIKKWAVGVTVAPRKNPTFGRCYESFLEAGFTPQIFKEPGVSIDPRFFKYGVTERAQRLGAWKNWTTSLAELRRRNPEADAYAIFQDDVVLCKNIKTYLEQELWPSPFTAFVSVFTPHCYRGNEAWNPIDIGRNLWMAQTFIFPPLAVDSILSHPIIKNWKGDKNIDSKIGEWAQAIGMFPYYHSPSLGQHVGHSSTLWADGNNPYGWDELPALGDRSASDFVGESFDAMQLLRGV